VRAALEGGINWFDTAELYGKGVSEASLAMALKAAGKSDAEVVVATKWWPLLRTAGNIPRTIQDRLRFLDGYSISLYMVHQPFSFSSPEAEMDAMADLVVAGKIRSVGVSNFNAERMRRAYHQLKQRGLPWLPTRCCSAFWTARSKRTASSTQPKSWVSPSSLTHRWLQAC